MDEDIGKNISKDLNGKYSKFDHVKRIATYVFKTALKKAIQKIAEATGDFSGYKITDKIAEVSKSLLQNNFQRVESKIEPKERHIPPGERQRTPNDLRLIW